MKQKHLSYLFFLFTLLISNSLAYSQVGIGTNTPKGLLDIQSTNSGVVYPTISLDDITDQTISNPNGPNIVPGTTVYNTNTTDVGINSVYPGIYVWGWDGSKNRWIPQFAKRDYAYFIQDGDVRTVSNTTHSIGFKDKNNDPVTGFTPKYTGLYKIEITVHYGGGRVRNPNTGMYANFAAEKGEFNFNTNKFSLRSYSARNKDNLFVGTNTDKKYENNYRQATYILEENLTAGNFYPFSLEFTQETAPDFVGNGQTNNNGHGYITLKGNVYSSIEFKFIGE